MSSGSLVERDQQLHLLASTVAASAESGRVILVSGEAGFGKTSLLRTLVESLDHRYLVLATACEPVGIPAAFAPLYDVLDQLPKDVRRDLRLGGGRPAVYAGMLDLLKNDRVILVIEDIHWADEATLGMVRYLGRRIEATGSCLIVSFRTEELDLTPLLRLVVADLGPAATRIDLQPLSLGGVELMARGGAVDPSAVYEATLGNPFFVEQVLNHPDQKLPQTIQNAVLAATDQLPALVGRRCRVISLRGPFPMALTCHQVERGSRPCCQSSPATPTAPSSGSIPMCRRTGPECFAFMKPGAPRRSDLPLTAIGYL